MNLTPQSSCLEQLKDNASFRDPAGFIFHQNGEVFRYVSSDFSTKYRSFRNSKLYTSLVEKGYLVSSEEIAEETTPQGTTLITKPTKIPFVSYPSEWTFSQLKEAAKLTLEIQSMCLKHNMSLKDASVYNVQYIGSQPIFIDTLSFEPWQGKLPWKAYRQFCQHFLAPLTLSSYCDVRLHSLYTSHLDGIPLDLAKRLLPFKSYLHPSRFLHLWLHETFQQDKWAKKATQTEVESIGSVPPKSAFGLNESLHASIDSLQSKKSKSSWNTYYQGDSYNDEAFGEKKSILETMLNHLNPQTVWDLGSNDGFFTELVSKHSKYSVAFDFDVTCLENMYQRLRGQNNQDILPLYLNIANPTPGIGWENKERKSLFDRGPCDLALALAVVHHLVVTAAIPLPKIVDFFRKVSRNLIIEYVPPTDPKFQQISRSNPNDFSFFTEEYFQTTFLKSFTLVKRLPIHSSKRTIYQFQAKT